MLNTVYIAICRLLSHLHVWMLLCVIIFKLFQFLQSRCIHAIYCTQAYLGQFLLASHIHLLLCITKLLPMFGNPLKVLNYVTCGRNGLSLTVFHQLPWPSRDLNSGFLSPSSTLSIMPLRYMHITILIHLATL